MGSNAYVITEPCVNVKDRSCVEVCPVDCIYELVEGVFVVPDNPSPGMDHQPVPKEGAGVHLVRDGTTEEDLARLRTQLVIHPDECIDCGACEAVCPVTAIFPGDGVPDHWEWFKDFNRRVFDDTQ